MQVGGPQESLDRDYLLRSVEIRIAERGGIAVDDEDEADYELNVLVGAVGIDVDGRFVGVRGAGGSSLIPFTIPELALYKTVRLDGFDDRVSRSEWRNASTGVGLLRIEF